MAHRLTISSRPSPLPLPINCAIQQFFHCSDTFIKWPTDTSCKICTFFNHHNNQHLIHLTFVMVSYHSVDPISDLIGLASTAAVVVWLVIGLEPAFKRARDSCRAGQLPEGRAQLLWSSLLVPIMWLAAALLYIHLLMSLWDVMGSCLESQPVNKVAYALLHFYLFSLLLCGLYACIILIVEISRNGQVLSDLLMIARFRPSGYHLVKDTEAQRGSSAPGRIGRESGTAGVVDVRNVTLSPHSQELGSTGQGFGEYVAPTMARTEESEHPAQEPTRSASDHPVRDFLTWAVERHIWLVDANPL